MCSTEDCPPEELPASDQAATTQATRQEVMTTEDSEDEATATQAPSEDVDVVIDVIGPTKGETNNLEDSDGSNEVKNDPTTEIADDIVEEVTTNNPVAESNQDNVVRDTTTTPGDTYDEQEYEEHEPITISEHTDHDEYDAGVTVGGRVHCYTCGSLFSSPTSDQSCDSFTPEAGQVAECGDGEVGDTLHCRYFAL